MVGRFMRFSTCAPQPFMLTSMAPCSAPKMNSATPSNSGEGASASPISAGQ